MSEPLPTTIAADEPILRVEDLKVHFPVTEGILIQHRVATVKAVDGVSFTIRAVVAGTAKRSAYGASCASGEDTPVCSSSGAMPPTT